MERTASSVSDGLQQVKLFFDVAEHHFAASDIEPALLPGRFEAPSFLVPFRLQLERKHLLFLLRQQQGQHTLGCAEL